MKEEWRKLQIEYLWSAALQMHQPVGVEDYVAHAIVAVFALILLSLTLYAWSRRRNFGLLLVSVAFLLFCVKEVMWLLYDYFDFDVAVSQVELVRVLLDLVVLALFFAAIIHRPRKQLE